MVGIISIDGNPFGKERPKFYNGHAVTPEKTKAYEKKVKRLWFEEVGHTFHGAVQVGIRALYKIPKSTPKSARRMMLEGERRPGIKPDIDNIAKVVLDGLNGMAFDDDKQVVSLTMEKVYDDNPQVIVMVKEI